MKLFKKYVSLLLCAAVAFAMLPATALAVSDPAHYTFDVSEGNIIINNADGGNLNVTYGASQNVIIPATQQIEITGTTTSNTVKVCSNVTADITLYNVSIRLSETGGCPCDIAGATVTLTLVGTNTLASGVVYAGLNCPDGSTLTIKDGTADGTGTLTATGNDMGAGIGGCLGVGLGNVTITGGTVTAQGGIDAAGIGGGVGYNGPGGSGGTVTINGGTVTAAAGAALNGEAGNAIGGGGYIYGGNVGAGGSCTITGGSVSVGNGGMGPTVYCDSRKTMPANLTTVTLSGVSSATAVTALTTGASFPYGMSDMYTDANGKIYLWLPSNATVTSATTLAHSYSGSVAANASGTLYGLPEITSVSTPASGVYGAGKNLDFVVNFDGAVTVNSASGTPYLPLTVGSSTVKAGYLSGSGTSALTFRYTVAPGDSDTDGVALGNTIMLNGGTIQSAQGANAQLVCHNTAPTSNVLVDTIAPTVTAVTPSGTGVSVGTASLSVTFSKAMDAASTGTVMLDNALLMNPSWDAAHKTVTYALPGLSYNTEYPVTIYEFMDTAGNMVEPHVSFFTTVQKNLTDAMVTDIAAQTYTGSAIKPGITVTDGAATLTEGTDYSVSYSGNTAAGTATAKVTGIGGYAGEVQKTFTIGQKAIVLTLTASPHDTANAGSNVTLTASVSGAVDLPQGTVTFRDGSTVIAQNVPVTGGNGGYSAQTVWSNVSDGSHSLTAEYIPASSGENYVCSAAATLGGYSVSKQNQTGFGFPSSGISKIYGDADFAVTASGGQGSGAITYASSDADIATVEADTGKVHIQKAGSVTITANKAADGNYNAVAATMTITVGKAAARITALPAAGNITVVGKLSSSTLTGGKGSVDGSFEWSNPDTVIASSGEYEVTFTPKDTDDYLPCTGKVQVAVSPNLTGSSGDISFDLTGVTLPSGVTSVSLGSSQSDTGNTEYTAVFKLVSGDTSLGNLKNLVLYDLKLLDQNGNPIENFVGKIKVKVKIPSGMSGNLHVYWYDSESNKLVDMGATQEDGYLIFDTTHFSFYAIAQLGASSPPVPNPKTGSDNWPFMPLTLLGGSSAAMLMAIHRKRWKIFRRQTNKG
ncbi:beta strand repeat-containing protein [Ethanoligenens sp.]|uniref:beta strand repeat-containing protein n=1 Tax=Ethanoligenens sp. TaxID=2099655 RepID=UPI0039EC0455